MVTKKHADYDITDENDILTTVIQDDWLPVFNRVAFVLCFYLFFFILFVFIVCFSKRYSERGPRGFTELPEGSRAQNVWEFLALEGN